MKIFFKSIWTSYCSNVCKFKDFKEFFLELIDGKQNKFLLIDRLEKPTQFRLGWDNRYIAKDLIENYLQQKNNIIIPYNIKLNKRKRIQSYDADFDNIKNENY